MRHKMTTPNLVDLSVVEFTDRRAGASLPGGGAAAALAGAQAAALAAMAARVTLGRPRDAAAAAEMAALRDAADASRARLLALVDGDARAYEQVLAAYQMPREAETQGQRAAAIQDAMRRATDMQLEVAGLCLEALQLAAAAAQDSIRSAAGDAIAGAFLAHAGLQAAARNVHINLGAIREPGARAALARRADERAAAGAAALAQGLAATDGPQGGA